MNRNRSIHTDHFFQRPLGGSSEPKKDLYGRISFNIPEVRVLSALGMTTGREDPTERHGVFRPGEGWVRDHTVHAGPGSRREPAKVIF